MKKWQARVCTSLLIITLAHVLYGASFVKSYDGFSLHQLITHALGYMWIGERIVAFYKALLE